MQHLIVRLLEHGAPGLFAEWALFDGGRKTASGETPVPLSEIPAQLPPAHEAERNVCVLTPGTQALLIRVDMPSGQRRHIKKLLPFLAEERIAEDVAAMHFAPAPQADKSDFLYMAAVRKTSVQSWLDALHAVGLFPRVMMPETLALPYSAGRVSLLCDETMAWLRTAPYLGMAGERGMLPDMLALLCAEAMASRVPVTCYIPRESEKDGSAAGLLETLGRYPQIEVQVQSVPGVMDLLCGECLSLMQADSALNILQGDYASKRHRSPSRAVWRKAGWIAAAWFILQIGIDAGQSVYFSAQEKQSRAEAVALYRQLFPAEPRIVDPFRQMKAHLSAVSGESHGILHMLQQLASRWPTADSPSLQMKSIAYHDDDHLLTLSVEAKNMEALNRLVRQMDGSGLSAGIVSVVNGENGVKGQLSIRGSER
jgi:general secretion pathway protein L